MITEKEIQATKLSATKKDFYQIWNELMDTAGKISERWDPTATNESDPGIVLLKVLSGIGDKLNYNIDKNTLECYMPSAAQADSMRKLCDMMGYNIKYYQSATTYVKISYDTSKTAISGEVLIDQYTNIKDADDSINYVLLTPVRLTSDNTSKEVEAIEGELIEVETDDDNVVSILQLDDNNRYYLPEAQVAENGIFVSNINDNAENTWEKVDNLNTQTVGRYVYKFGYDSKLGLPYLQFPSDISTIIEDGLRIKYIRTSGINGNISARTLSKMEKPLSWNAIEDTSADYYNVDNYTVTNTSAATTGKNLESINDAYNNYKKTIGTFDTLVTCRDYINKIYNMTTDSVDQAPLVSNVIVSDIRDDINKAITLCTFNEYGIKYQNMSRPSDIINAEETGHVIGWFTDTNANATNFNKIFKVLDTDNTTIIGYKKCIYNGNAYEWKDVSTHEIDHFDLVLYPFRTVTGLNSYLEYTKSFKYDTTNINEILTNLEDSKTLSHNIIDPEKDEIACIKNYLKIKTKITTIRKVNAAEEASILDNVYKAIYKNFNLRKLDFGNSINLETIREVILNADARIKEAPIEDPVIITKYCTVSGQEYDADTAISSSDQNKPGAIYFNKLALNNVLAGRIAMFNYNENFKPSFTESGYPSWTEETGQKSYAQIYPASENDRIYKLTSEFKINASAAGKPVQDITLQENEVVQFRAPNLKTTNTYAAYVNYYLHLIDNVGTEAIPATMQSLKDYLDGKYDVSGETWQQKWTLFANHTLLANKLTETTFDSETAFNTAKSTYYTLFIKNTDDKFIIATSYKDASTKYYYFELNANTFGAIDSIIKEQNAKYIETGTTYAKLKGLYLRGVTNVATSIGYLVDANHTKYSTASAWQIGTKPMENLYFVQITYVESVTTGDSKHTQDGLGQSVVVNNIKANEEYKLQNNEYLLINYTTSSTDSTDNGTTTNTKVNIVYTSGTIIKPNFALGDSNVVHSTKNYEKTEGYDFIKPTSGQLPSGIGNPAGMFTMGTNEQIEIRELATVTLNEPSSNLYWERNDEEALTYIDGKITFKFDERPINKTTGEYVENPTGDEGTSWIYSEYTLKEGEYFYYTDKNKLSLVYYGNGTKIKRTIKTPTIYKYKSDASVTAEDIATYGLSASIPWRVYNLSGENSETKALTLTEYQYVNLINGNILKGISNSDTGTEATTIDIQINNTWRECSAAKYSIDGNISTLPPLRVDNAKWEVRSKLEFNVGPILTQTLHCSDNTTDIINVFKPNSNTPLVSLTAHKVANEYRNLSFKTNMLIQKSVDSLDTTIKYYNTEGQQVGETKAPLQIKLFETKTVKDVNSSTINMNNFSDGQYTKLSFEAMTDAQQTEGKYFTSLHAVVPDTDFGLLLLYYNEKDSSGDNNAYIKFTNDEVNNNVTPKIFNASGSLFDNNKWWVGLSGGGKYYLRPGINIVQIDATTNIEIYPDANRNSSVIVGQLDTVKKATSTTTPINTKLNYKKIDVEPNQTNYDQLLKDINKVDINHEFYYNMLLDNNSLVDLNPYDSTETLESPIAWYDYNNINNKFVVSEIDADYLTTGIVLSNSSKQ